MQSYRAAIYARVSSLAQREAQTIEAQLAALPALCQRNGWPIVGTYVDDGRSAAAGKLAAREGLRRLLADATAKAFDVVVVWDVDRLTRSEDPGERGAILGALAVAGVRVASLNGGLLDPRSSEGDLMLGVQAWAAADWLRKHRERVKAGKDRAIAAGKKPAGPTPYGYRYDRATGIWSVNEEQAAVVAEIHRRVSAGESCLAIAEDLHLRGEERPRSGRWSRERVWALAVSRTYLGEWLADKRRGLKLKVPRVLEHEVWQRTQDQLAAQGKRGLVRTQHDYLLQDMAVCALCGVRVYIASASTSYPREGRNLARAQARYVCGARRRPIPGEDRCALPYRFTGEVDGRLWGALVDLLNRGDLIDRVAKARRVEAGSDADLWRRDAAQAESKLARLVAAEAAMLARFRRGLISEAAMDAELAAAGRERAALERQLETARRASARASRTVDQVETMEATVVALRARLDQATATERRGLARLLLAEKVRLGVWTIESVVRLHPQAVGLARAAGYSSGAPDLPARALEFRLVA